MGNLTHKILGCCLRTLLFYGSVRTCFPIPDLGLLDGRLGAEWIVVYKLVRMLKESVSVFVLKGEG